LYQQLRVYDLEMHRVVSDGAIAILNGAIRQTVILPLVGELTAHQISCFTGIILLGLYMYWVVRKWTPVSMRQAVGLGILWVAMTIVFEFVFGHYVMGNPWERLFHDYDLCEKVRCYSLDRCRPGIARRW
jgi:hypothetical protein